MYGSSLRTETARPRALRSRPTLAAVMPLPREEVTPPVTKTYFAIARFSSGGFSNSNDERASPQTVPASERRDVAQSGRGYCDGDPEGLMTIFNPSRAAAVANAALCSLSG